MADKPETPADPEVVEEETQPSPIEAVATRLEQIQNLSDDELGDFEAEVRELAETVLEDPSSDIAEAEQLAAAVEAIRAEGVRRVDAAEERKAKAEEIRARLEPAAETETPPGEGDGEGDEPETPPAETPPAETAPPQAKAAAAKPAPASATVRELASTRPARRAPRPASPRKVAIFAGGDVRDFSAGQALTADQLGQAFATKYESAMQLARGRKQTAGKLYVGTIRAPWPEERALTASAQENGDKIAKLLDTATTMQSLTASGGLCAPLEASYDLVQISERGRPVKGALAGFRANRGGMRWITPPQLANVEDAVALWTHENDANPSSPATKPCLSITCGEEQTAQIDAIPLCLEVGNFDRMTFPENFQRWYALALAWHDRFAESNLLTEIGTGSVAIVDGQNLGATRDLLESWGRAAATYRSRNRMDPEAPLTILVPQWVPDMMQADLAREMPGAPEDRLAFTRSMVDRFFAARNLRVVYYMDSAAGKGQILGAQPLGAMVPWPSTVVSYLFHPGAWLFLDGGTLDLGVEIRDSGLNATNDVRAFLETFEAVAFTGIESFEITNTVCVSGQAAALEELTCPTLGS